MQYNHIVCTAILYFGFDKHADSICRLRSVIVTSFVSHAKITQTGEEARGFIVAREANPTTMQAGEIKIV